MSKLTDLLNQIVGWIEDNNSEEWNRIRLDTGLSHAQIQHFYEGNSFIFPTEIVDLYQWHDGGNGSFFIDAHGIYGDQHFNSLGWGLSCGEDWSRDYCPDKKILALFACEDVYWWTILPDTSQEAAPIYVSDEPDFDTCSPNYPSLTAMLEEMIQRL